MTGKIRIIGGKLRNSRLLVPDLPGLRPTPERVRETLFNWLAPHLPGCRTLDLFAGTGALGIEALSRGAANVVFIEQHRKAAQALRENLERLKQTAIHVYQADAQDYLQGHVQPFDLIFVDPPFALGLWQLAVNRLEQGGWLQALAWIYLETPQSLQLDLPENWQTYRMGVAGEVRYTLYRRMAVLG